MSERESTLERQGAIAGRQRSTIHPFNALGIAVREGLQDSLQAAEADPQVQAIVLVCEGSTFIAGADIKNLESGKITPPGRKPCPKWSGGIEAGSKPSVAVIPWALHWAAVWKWR